MYQIANSEDQVTFQRGLHQLLRQKRSSEKEIQFCNPSIYAIPYVYCIELKGRSWVKLEK